MSRSPISRSSTAHAMRDSLTRVAEQLGHEYPLIIGGERVKTRARSSPSIRRVRRRLWVSIRRPARSMPSRQCRQRWGPSNRGGSRRREERASLLLGAAEIIRQRKFEFCAWLTYEVGKNWAEADADVGETIDFLEFYAREALRLAAATTPIQLPGEHDELLYIPLGVGAVIPPWNFPFAIMAGMTVASIVTGNTVMLKPSSDSPTIAAQVH